MSRSVLAVGVLLALSATSAQAQLLRAEASALVHETSSVALAYGIETQVLGPVAAGAHLTQYGRSSLGDDAFGVEGTGGDVYAAVSVGRGFAVRALAGLGIARVDDIKGFDGPFEPAIETVTRPYAVAGVGVDVYPVPVVGMGAEVRAVASRTETSLSLAGVGLRLCIGC